MDTSKEPQFTRKEKTALSSSRLKGASLIAHNLKEYGGSMQGGLERLSKESRKAGKQEGFQQGVNFALNKLSLLERITGRQFGKK